MAILFFVPLKRKIKTESLLLWNRELHNLLLQLQTKAKILQQKYPLGIQIGVGTVNGMLKLDSLL